MVWIARRNLPVEIVVRSTINLGNERAIELLRGTRFTIALGKNLIGLGNQMFHRSHQVGQVSMGGYRGCHLVKVNYLDRSDKSRVANL